MARNRPQRPPLPTAWHGPWDDGWLLRRAVLRAVFLVLLAMAMFAWGLAAERYGIFPGPDLERLRALLLTPPPRLPFERLDGKTEIPCPDPARAIVLVGLGEGLLANGASNLSRPDTNQVVNLFEGRCYRLSDPVLGATGETGSLWPQLATRLAEETGRPVAVLALAVHDTSILDWTGPDSRATAYALEQIAAARVNGFRPTALLWSQGRSDHDRRLRPAVYRVRLEGLIRRFGAAGVEAPWLVAQSSYSGLRRTASPALRVAQDRVIAVTPRALPGADMDIYQGRYYRLANGDWTHNGTVAAAEAWGAALDRAGVLRADFTPDRSD